MFHLRRRTSRPNPDDVAGLMRALAAGNEDAMTALYDMHGGLVYRFALQMARDESVAEEVTQDVFLALFRQAASFDPTRARLSTWLCGIARRQLWKHFNRNPRFDDFAGADDLFEPESPAPDPCALLTSREAVATVQRGIDAMPLPLKEVLVLCELEEMTYEDVAAALGIPVGTVRSRLHRAKQRLAGLLRPAKESF